ncbi:MULTISPECIES: hypothetical protein [Hydrocarboniphaga]|uniref:Bacteriophage tail tape measure C-terminal domain-containing protein n=1 Tax=Hydrocarboniphaga effusa AP103 TaxID=1172194 RepID=I8T8F9_9GAMM|nr:MULTISPECIES: hypothetical protein [Hydrocarboniphaga]EIT70008.1 hypothetical protein WQQ_01450 [Hydrocarboniphaga effusa AP103]EIT70195.1 hypothetical protein WQQ_03320 [Hydrocarboniphaga effusa AP103]MDZ4077175.1 hypothetical protein [Hydrocarboniphaga sp.]
MNLGSIGSVFIDVAANTAKFETDIGRASRESEKRAREIQKGFQDAAKNIAASLAALDIGRRLGEGLRAAIERADELDEMAQKVGASVRGLSGLKFAADLEGVDGLTEALAKLSKAMVESEKAGSEQGRAFAALGINVRDASGQLKTSDVVLREMAEAFAQSEDGATKSAVAMALLGRSGADMIPFLNNGAEGLDRLTRKAEELGLVIDDEIAAAAGEFNDNLFILQASASGLASRVAADLLPSLRDLTAQFTETSATGDVAAGLADSLRVGFQGVALVVANVSYVFEQIGREIGGIAAQAVALAHLDFSGAAAIHDAMVADAADARRRIDELNTALLNLGKTDEQVRTRAAKAEAGDGKSQIKFGPEATFDGRFDLKSIEADALRPLREQITAEHDLLEQRLQQEQDYHKASYDAEIAAEQRRKGVADSMANYQRQQIDAMVTQADAIAGVLSMAADAASAFGAKGFAVFKALKIAEAMISIPSSAIKAYESALAVPVIGPALAPAAAAAAVAVQLAQVQQIRSMQFSGRRYGGIVSAGGMYEVAEPGNPELLRYGNKTLLMMGSQSGVVEPASAIAPLSSGGGGVKITFNDNVGVAVNARQLSDGQIIAEISHRVDQGMQTAASRAVGITAAQLASRSGDVYAGLQAGSVVQRRNRNSKVYG